MTTIQISKDLQEELSKKKMFVRQTYEEVIWDLIEDQKELSEETLKNIEISKKQYENGEYVTLENLKKKYGLGK